MRRPEALAAGALGLVLTVVVVSAAIRLGATDRVLGALRIVHRSAATLEVVLLGALAFVAWREPAWRIPVALAAALTVLLAAIGIVAGQAPSAAASMGNILGGLALAACFAWMIARPGQRFAVAALVGLQCALGAALSLTWRDDPLALLAGHVLLGLALVATIGWLALRGARLVPALLALAVAASGAAAAFLDRAFAPALAHSAAVALLVSAAALGRRRSP